MQTCIWPSWCHYHSLSLASVKSRLVLLFWYWLTQVVLEKGPLNARARARARVRVRACVRACVCISCTYSDRLRWHSRGWSLYELTVWRHDTRCSRTHTTVSNRSFTVAGLRVCASVYWLLTMWNTSCFEHFRWHFRRHLRAHLFGA